MLLIEKNSWRWSGCVYYDGRIEILQRVKKCFCALILKGEREWKWLMVEKHTFPLGVHIFPIFPPRQKAWILIEVILNYNYIHRRNNSKILTASVIPISFQLHCHHQNWNQKYTITHFANSKRNINNNTNNKTHKYIVFAITFGDYWEGI